MCPTLTVPSLHTDYTDLKVLAGRNHSGFLDQNHEKENYQAGNVQVRGGALHIVGRKQRAGKQLYTSGRINTSVCGDAQHTCTVRVVPDLEKVQLYVRVR